MKFIKFLIITHLFIASLSSNIFAEEADEVILEIKLENHRFLPEIIKAPANKKIILLINNLDSTIDEFDSPSLKREKILKSNSITRIILAPLAPGRYDFVGEFYSDTARGSLIVEEVK